MRLLIIFAHIVFPKFLLNEVKDLNKQVVPRMITNLLMVLWIVPCLAQPGVDSKSHDQYVGIYQVAPQHFISIAPFDLGNGRTPLAFLDFKSGRFGLLQSASEEKFVSGPGWLVNSPVDVEITFVRNEQPNVSGLVYRNGDSLAKKASKIDSYKQEKVSFRNGDVTLAGTLTLPSGRGPFPAIAILHGSGNFGRNFFGPLQHFFVRHGIAVLAYDKRGAGASTGKRTASFDDYTGDALAGVRFLKTHRDIKQNQIGLWGASQGGWIAPLVAFRSKDIAFVILHAGPALSPAQNDVVQTQQVLRVNGFSEQEIKEAIELMNLEIEYTRTGEGWERLEAAVQRAKDKSWSRYVGSSSSKDDPSWQARRMVQDYNPIPALEGVTVPFLAFFGELDTSVPVEGNKEAMAAALKRARNKDHTIVVLPKANHVFLEAETGKEKELPRSKRFVMQYFDTMAAWLRERGYSSK
jgi:uncharacterized protein